MNDTSMATILNERALAAHNATVTRARWGGSGLRSPQEVCERSRPHRSRERSAVLKLTTPNASLDPNRVRWSGRLITERR